MKYNTVQLLAEKKGTAALMAAALSVVALSGCGSAKATDVPKADSVDAAVEETADADDAADTAETADGEVKKITFGSGYIQKPYCYTDENGDVVGFEYDLIAAIDEVLPQYEIEAVPLDWKDLLTSVQIGKIDVAGWQIQKTPEREEEYLFSDDYVSVQDYYLIVSADNNDVHSIEDLQDVAVNGGAPDEFTYKFWEEYAAEHPEQNIEIRTTNNYFDEAGLEGLKNGSIAAVFETDGAVALVNARAGEDIIKAVGDQLHQGHGYYVFNKENTELKEAFDGAIKELKENGTYDEIYDKWFAYLKELHGETSDDTAD